MDNVSHTVAGMLAAETLLAARAPGRLAPQVAGFGRIAWVTSALANNLPDADLLYTAVDRSPLGYLLHHRGHTHTLALGLPLGLLALAVPWLWSKRKGHAIGREGWSLLILLALLGPLLHLALDSSNNYGVHPFWPVWNGWLYGDTIFIIEPLFWAFGLSLLLPSMRSRLAQGIFGLLLVVILGVCWAVPFVPRGHALFVTLLAAALLALGWRRGPHARMAWAVGLSLATVALFGLGSARARAALYARAEADFPGWRLHDAVLTPLPTNPLCWEAVTVMTQGGQYALRRAQVSPWPGLRAPEACPRFSLERPSTLVYAPLARGGGGVAWHGEHLSGLPRMQQVFREDCVAQAFLRFSRAPFVLEQALPAPVNLLVGDARFDNEEGLGFAELSLRTPPLGCPERVPSWTPPRAELFPPGAR